MPIDFGVERWKRVREVYARWWSGQLDRPIIPVELSGRAPDRPRPAVPLLSQGNCARLDIPADDVIDAIDYELSTKTFLGDAFPRVNLDAFGPGVLAAMLGATLDNSTGRVWFHPPDIRPLDELHFVYDPDNVWLRRIEGICRAANRRWQGQVLVGMADLGGNLDILAAFRPTENLLMDLYDVADHVERLVAEAHQVWHQVYARLNEALEAETHGYTDWAGIYSDRPCYMLQCDFSYMISPRMFEQFARPELEATCRRLPRSFYHLDGPGQLPHLNHILDIGDLDGVQWVPGAGNPACAEWPEIYAKIHRRDKKIQLVDGGFETIDAVVDAIGTARGLHHIGIHGAIKDRPQIERRLRAYGID